ncbi:MAG: EAL domain-containing protein [Leptospiraceae bacterium]|nr:EAL domain-containing protein [Leptospiraceae bacterium]MCK6379649.1 EAL domain-containing protein [Leptospiraceae bacterium]NUM40103.1 EAL domain-containing protein [Leptospiraceae bacterium]
MPVSKIYHFLSKPNSQYFLILGLGVIHFLVGIITSFLVYGEIHGEFFVIIPISTAITTMFLYKFFVYSSKKEKENEERLIFLTEASSEGIVVHEKGIVLEANPAAEKMFGTSIGESIGKEITQFFAEALTDEIVQKVRTNLPVVFEIKAKRKDGTVFPVEVLGRTLSYRGRTVRVSALRDISIQKQSENQKEFLKMIPKISSEGFWLLDENQKTVDVNESLCKMLGYSKEEFLGRRPIEFATDEGIRNLKKITAMIRSTNHRKYEIPLRHKSGTVVHTIFSASTIRGEKGEAIYSFAFVTDITENKKNELKIEKLNRLYSILYKTNEAILRLKDPNSLFNFVCNISSYKELFKMVWVGMLNKEGTALLPVAFAGSTGDYLDNLNILISDDSGDRHCIEGNAFREGAANYSNDVYNDSNMILCSKEILKNEFRSVAAIPLFLDSKPVGTVSFYSSEINYFNIEIITLLETLARDLSYAIKSSEMEKSRKITEEALRKSEERYSLSALAANDGLWDMDIDSGEVYFSTRWKTMLGYSDSDIGKSVEEFFKRVHPDDLEELKSNIQSLLDGHSTLLYSEHRMRQKDGTYIWVLIRGISQFRNGKACRIVGSQSDIHSRKIAEEKLSYDALYDRLTGLPNRNFIMEKLNASLEKIKTTEGFSFAVLFIDLDRFKNINDSLGHLSGDKLLKEVGERLKKVLRETDTFGRLGGDEFLIVMEPADSVSELNQFIENIFNELVDPFTIGNHDFFVTTSIGVAIGSPKYNNSEEMLRDADIAMYRAKDLGKNTFQIFQKDMTTNLLEHVTLETNLRKALKRKEFVLYYQPKISLKDMSITGFEALIRWRSSDSKMIPPNDFIPLTEETGLIVQIGEWVVREACLQIQKWEKAGFNKLDVSVNYSAKNFKQKNTCTLIQDTLSEFNLLPHLLNIELTESSVMENPEYTVKVLNALKEIGVSISIDDFGTGYSSLNYLKKFPVDILKIDRSFVQDIVTNPNDAAITTAIIALSHILKLEVVAEGVETKEQLQFLRANGCDFIQGYFFSPPLPAEATETFLNNFKKQVSLN